MRYVPNAIKGESVNIGLIVQEIAGEFAEVYFTKNLERARGLDPDIDKDLLLAIGHDIENRFRDADRRLVLLSELVDRYSNAVQLSSPRTCVMESPAKEMKFLIDSMIETRLAPIVPSPEVFEEAGVRPERRIGRKWLRSAIKKAFWAENLQNVVYENLPAAAYMNYTDDFTIDFSYMHGNEWECFQAVSLINIGLETRMFPLRAAKIKTEAPKLRTEQARFTAVVEDYYNTEDKDVKTILAFMNAENIRVARALELPDIARQARTDLRMS